MSRHVKKNLIKFQTSSILLFVLFFSAANEKSHRSGNMRTPHSVDGYSIFPKGWTWWNIEVQEWKGELRDVNSFVIVTLLKQVCENAIFHNRNNTFWRITTWWKILGFVRIFYWGYLMFVRSWNFEFRGMMSTSSNELL